MGIIKLKKNNEETIVSETTITENNILSKTTMEGEETILPRAALCEKKGKRKENQDVFRFNDGTTKQFISGVPVNYWDKQVNAHKKIQTRLLKDGKGDLECTENLFETKFYMAKSAPTIYSMKKDNCEVLLQADKMKQAEKEFMCLGDEKNNKVVFRNVQEGVDIEYEVEPNQIKENIIIKKPQMNYVFDFGISLVNLNVSVTEDYGALELKNKETGNTVFKIPSPVMYDANGEYSDAVRYEIDDKNGALAIQVIADEEYFNAPDRAFPVVIDPQVMVEADELISHQTYYRARGSSESAYNWNQTTSQYIKVLRNGSYDYRTIVTIDKSKIELLDSTINSVKLRLRKYSVSEYGYILINGKTVYMGSDDLLVDITSTFKSYSDTAKFNIAVEPYNAYVNGLFYASGTYAPEMEIEYLGNNDKPAYKRFSLTTDAMGVLDIGTGEIVTSFEVANTNDLSVHYGISHIFKQSEEDFGLGDNFRFNLHERLEKNYSNCNYTDSFGKKILFTEHYYYLDDAGNKQYVSKSSVETTLEGKLTYTEDSKIFEVKVEYRSSTGLKVVATPEYIKNAELIEQRSDELKQLENQVLNYENVLDDYVLINMNSYEISWQCSISPSKYEALKNPSYCCLVLTHSDALQYKNLKKQWAAIELTSMSNYIPGLKNEDNSLSSKAGSAYAQLLSLENSFAVLNNQLIEYLDTIDDLEEVKVIVNNGRQEVIPYNQFYGISQTGKFEFYDGEAAKEAFGTDLVDMFYQRNLLIKQIEETKASLNLQMDQLCEQIALIESKREKQIQQFNNYYKEYVNLKYEMLQMIKHSPVIYLTDGTLYKGFNKYGDLVAIMDGYGNALSIEYADSTESARQIRRVYDGEDKIIAFEYNSDGRLNEITDTRGRNIKFTYNAPTIVNGAETQETSNRLYKVEVSNGQTLKFKYTLDNTNGKYEIYEVDSDKKLTTRLTYSSGKLSGVYNYSSVSSISHGESVDSADELPMGHYAVNYTDDTTVIVDPNANREAYLFNADEFVIGESREEGGVVVSAKWFDYIPYEKNHVYYAKKDCLYQSSLDEFVFKAGDNEITTLNAFNNPIKTETNMRALNIAGTVTKKVTVEYAYNNEQKVIQEKTTISVTGKENIYLYKKYNYNAWNLLVRTESYVAGEEFTTGKNIEETVYDDKGNAVKSFSYNSLDTSSKFYSETEYDENGKVTAELDETGENKTKFVYKDGTNVVCEEQLPNGSKFAYGHDSDDSVTAISQSTEDGEENSTQRVYRSGELVELRSGNNKVKYAYNHKRKLKSVELNGEEDYVTYDYVETTDSIGTVSAETVTATYKSGDVFVAQKDGKGNVLQSKVNDVVQIENTYDKKNNLVTVKDKITGKNYQFERDDLDRLTAAYEIDNSGIQVSSGYGESSEYDEFGTLKKRTIVGPVSQVYNYTYKTDAKRAIESIAVGNVTVKPKLDIFDRNKGKELLFSGIKIAEENISYRKVGDHATNMPSTIWFGDKANGSYQVKDSVRYAYDKMGNIEKVYENGELAIRYHYDVLNRLVREDNKILDKTLVFVYDNNGNIVKQREFVFTLKDNTSIEELESTDKAYIYNGDKLLSFNGQACAYDVIGNPTTYRGKTATWAKGRQLVSYDGHTFTYDGQGRRLTKDSISYTYDINGKLLKQSNGLEFFYDHTGVAGVIYNGSTYLYRKDVLGNILAILDSNGGVVARYIYDAWGNHSVINANGAIISDTSHIANLNPFRYRGYYFDTETKLYFLKTRYYDAETGRFMTIDDISYIDSETINGLNLYSYCANNPVKNVDSWGTSWWSRFWSGVGNWFSDVGSAIWNGIKTAATAVGDFFVTYGAAIGAGLLAVGALAVGIVGSIFTGGLLGAVILGAGVGFFAGVTSNMSQQVSQNGWANMNFGAAMKSGGIGAAIGALSGVVSYAFGTIGAFYGQMAGNALSSMTIAGLNVGKAFAYLGGSALFSALGSGAGYILGSFLGTAMGNELISNFFGINPSTQENITEGIHGLTLDGIINFFKLIFGR